MSSRLTRLVLFCYPRSIRAAYGDELARALAARAGDRRESRMATAGFLWLAISDAVRARWTSRAEARWLRTHHGSRRVRVGADTWTDLRMAGRAFRRAPGFFAGVVLTIALGVGANTTVFSLVKAVVLQPLPYDRPGELVMVWRSFVEPDPVVGHLRGLATPRDLLAWRDQAADVMTVAGVEATGSLDAQMDLATPAGAERLNGALATPNLFDVLGVRAHVGRVFTRADAEVGATDVVVLGHGLWRRAFGGDASVVGRTITLVTGWNASRAPRRYRVIGVLGPAVRLNYPDEVEVWRMRPWAAVERESPTAITYQVVGRLQPGVSFAVASQRMTGLARELMPPRPGLPAGQQDTVRLERMHDWVVGDTPPAMAFLAAVAGLLLVITCATVANALFIRLGERRRELALRTALGANRGRLVRQLLLEGLALATAGTAVGLVLSTAVLPPLRLLVPDAVPRGNEAGIDGFVLAFAAGSVLIVTLLTSLAPAWRGARQDVAAALKRSSASVSADRETSRFRRVLVGLQAGVATVLLVAAALLLSSFWRIVNVPVGFDAGGVVTAEIRLLGDEIRSADRQRLLQQSLRERVSAIPGVERVALTSAVPFRGVDWFRGFEVDETGREVSGNRREVDAAYFDVMNIELLAGRLFTDADGPGAPPVVVLSEAWAREAFGADTPLGRRLGPNGPTVVGIVGDVRYQSYTRDPMRAVYLPIAQSPSVIMCLLVKPYAGRTISAGAIRRAVAEVDPTLPAMRISTIDAILSESLADRRFYLTATLVFAALALVLTLVGLVVIVLRSIVERRREMAIRAALGASAGRLHAHVAGGGLAPVAVGVAAGLTVTFASANVLSSFLFGVAPRSLPVYLSVAALLLTSAAVVGWLAGRRVSGIAPALALRAE